MVCKLGGKTNFFRGLFLIGRRPMKCKGPGFSLLRRSWFCCWPTPSARGLPRGAHPPSPTWHNHHDQLHHGDQCNRGCSGPYGGTPSSLLRECRTLGCHLSRGRENRWTKFFGTVLKENFSFGTFRTKLKLRPSGTGLHPAPPPGFLCGHLLERFLFLRKK